MIQETGYLSGVHPDETHRALATVLSCLTGRTLTKEEIWTALDMSRSTWCGQLEKGTVITAVNLWTAAANLGINRADLLAASGVMTIPAKRAKVSTLQPRRDAPAL